MQKRKQTTKRSNDDDDNDDDDDDDNTNWSNFLEIRNVKYKYLERILINQFNSFLIYIRVTINSESNFRVSRST
jgi:hypothetical protein